MMGRSCDRRFGDQESRSERFRRRTIRQAKELNEILANIGLPTTHVPSLSQTRPALKECICGRLFHPRRAGLHLKPADITDKPPVVRKGGTEAVFDQRMKGLLSTIAGGYGSANSSKIGQPSIWKSAKVDESAEI
jgi:hypothetical protein